MFQLFVYLLFISIVQIKIVIFVVMGIRIKKNIITICITALLIIASMVVLIYCELNAPLDKKGTITLEVTQNASIRQIIENLNEQKLLQPLWFYEITAKIYSYWTKRHIFAGVHKFKTNISNFELLIALFSGKNLFVKKVTFPEGITIKKFASILNKQLGTDSIRFVELCYNIDFIKKLNLNVKSLEGYLMPATFNFFIDIKIEDIIKTLVKEQIRICKRYEQNAKSLGWTTNQVLTLASIIEAETPVIAERKIISGVYHNRLRRKMLLQADPTVQYTLDIPKKRLLFADLKIKSPYNTYIHKGLPPTPINSPSSTSIEAAVEPEKNKYLYFVAKGNGSNEHYFSTNFTEHKKNIAKYKNKRSK